MKKTRKFGKRRNLVKKHKSRRKAKGKTYEEAVSALLSKKLNDVHSRTYGQEFVDPGDPSLVSQILSHLPASWIKEANEEQRLVEVISDLQQNIEKQKQQLILLSLKSIRSDVNKRQALYQQEEALYQQERAIQLAETLQEVNSDIFKKYGDYISSDDYKNKHCNFLERMLFLTIDLTKEAENNSKIVTRILNDSSQSRQSRQSKQSRHSTRYGRTK